MKNLLLLLLFVASFASVRAEYPFTSPAPQGIALTIVNDDAGGYHPNFLNPGGSNGLLVWDASAQWYFWAALGSGMTWDGVTKTMSVAAPSWSSVTGKPSFSTVATTGAYSDLSGRPTRTFNNAAAKTLVTSATGQGGVVLDASRDADVSYSIATSTTATIGGASGVTVFLEIADTNSASAGSWTTIVTISNVQTITLAVVLSSKQDNTLCLAGKIPAGKFMRVRYSLTGTASASYTTGQEVLL